ncbi:hypothetical protein, partial [Candidatus Phytoplasma fabacearum]
PILKLVFIINSFLYFLFNVITVTSSFGCLVNGEKFADCKDADELLRKYGFETYQKVYLKS